MNVLKTLGIRRENPAGCGAMGWLKGKEGSLLPSCNPATGKVIASIRASTATDYDAIAQASAEAQRAWAGVPAPARGEVVRRIADVLREYKDALGTLVAMECGKIKSEGDGEVQEMIDIADFAVGQSRMLYGKTMHSERPEHRMYEQWHPLGVVGVISAFNFPVAVWAWNAFIAAICGNTVIWKPSPKTPLSAIAVQQLCNRVMRETGHPGVFSLFIPADNTIAVHLVDDRRVGLVSFTGSSATGHLVARRAARRLGRYLLECSGNNAVIVDETADLDLAVPAIVFGAVGTAGQRCTTTRRLFIQESIHDTLVERLVSAYRQVRVGDPLKGTTLMGPLIDTPAVDAYRAAVRELQQRGGQILAGGEVLRGPGCFVQPTLATVPRQLGIVKRETFAPILYVMRYRDLEEAIHLQNDVPQGLSSALFTDSVRNAELFLSLRGSDCGIANVNIGTSGAEIGGAFGGEKETGGGREAGSDCWKAYMRRQTNTINWGRGLPLAQGIRFDLS